MLLSVLALRLSQRRRLFPGWAQQLFLVDIDPNTYNMHPASLRAAIKATIRDGKLRPKTVISADLFGQPTNLPRNQNDLR